MPDFPTQIKEALQHNTSAEPSYFGVLWQTMGNVTVTEKAVKLTMIETSGSDEINNPYIPDISTHQLQQKTPKLLDFALQLAIHIS